MLFDLELRQKDSQIVISNTCWEIIHDAKKGGCITSIRFLNDLNKNILKNPVSSILKRHQYGSWTAGEFRESRDENAKLSIVKNEKDYIELCAEAELKGRSGEASEMKVRTIYCYYPGHCRIEKDFSIGKNAPDINRFTVVAVETIPELDRWMARPSPVTNMKQASANSFIKQQGYPGPARWGTFDSYEVPFYDFNMPLQLALYRRDGEALELTLDSDYANWLHGADPSPDAVRYSYIRTNYDPESREIGIEPLCGAENGKFLPKGKEYHYNFFLSLPNNTADGPKRDLQCTCPVLRFRKGRRWATEDEVRQMAENGVQLVIHHHDSPSGRGLWEPGSFFWPTGVPDPYNDEEKAHLREVIGYVHKYGMKIIPYFNPFELHPLCREFSRHRDEWGRYFDGHYVENHTDGGLFGIACCLGSGYFDYLKWYIKEVVTKFGFDGCYFDGLAGNYCEHPAHAQGKEHTSNSEMFELAMYARKLAGPDGIVIMHNTGAPGAGLENYCNTAIAMEDVCGFPNFECCVPKNGHFGEIFRYGRNIPWMICAYTALGSGMPDPEIQEKKMLVRILLEGFTYYGLRNLTDDPFFRYWREFKTMKKEHLRFLSVHAEKDLTLSNALIRSALLINEEEALLLLGNPDSGETQKTSFELTLPDGSKKTGNAEIAGYDFATFRFSLQ